MYRRILVPLDGSPLAEAALPHATAVARRFDAGLTLLQVVSTLPVATTVDTTATAGAETVLAVEAIEATEQAAVEYLNEVAHRPELAGIPVEVEVVRGGPAREIVRQAQRGKADLIVMSTHGRSGLGRLVFGSVADEVLREAGIPILLIRPRSS
ncbi:MAG: universal stress protein [Chloroflexota bacterium]